MMELQPITAENRAACCALRVTQEQSKYIAPNVRSLAQAAEAPTVARPFLLVSDGTPVGFAMFAFDEENEDKDDRYWLWRLMLDEKQQGKGLGRAAMQRIMAYFEQEGADTVTLSTKPDNTRALQLYHSFGFAENGQWNDDEIVLKCKLR